MRVPITAGNWKMYKTVEEASAFAEALLNEASSLTEVEMIVCPPYTALSSLSQYFEGTPLALGAQNMHWETQGAYTGEISALMLKETGCSYVILGHSERRHVFHETSGEVGKKVATAFENELVPILCVGETIEEREQGRTQSVVQEQLMAGIDRLGSHNAGRLVIAYEPVWAIGTGKASTPEDAREVVAYIRSLYADRFGKEVSESIRILYGGSVKPDNVYEFVKEEQIDGTLVGGASLDPVSFLTIAGETRRVYT